MVVDHLSNIIHSNTEEAVFSPAHSHEQRLLILIFDFDF